VFIYLFDVVSFDYMEKKIPFQKSFSSELILKSNAYVSNGVSVSYTHSAAPAFQDMPRLHLKRILGREGLQS